MYGIVSFSPRLYIPFIFKMQDGVAGITMGEFFVSMPRRPRFWFPGYSLLIKHSVEEKLTVMMGGDRTRTHLAETPQEIFSFLYQLIMHHLCFGVSPQTAMALERRRKETEHSVSVFTPLYVEIGGKLFSNAVLNYYKNEPDLLFNLITLLIILSIFLNTTLKVVFLFFLAHFL